MEREPEPRKLTLNGLITLFFSVVATPTGKPAIQSVTPAELLKQHKLEIKQRRLGGIPPSDPLKSTPMLGKGFTPGKEICFDVSSPKLSLSKVSLKCCVMFHFVENLYV